MAPTTELASLRQGVVALRHEMNALRRFITIETDKETGEPCNLNLTCGVLSLVQPEPPHERQMILSADDTGPAIGLWDNRQKARIVLSVEDDTPTVTLYTAGGKQAVLLHEDPEHGHGLAAVFENGNPRALMKAAADGGRRRLHPPR